MKIEYRNIEGGVVQITTCDERWYKIEENFMPSYSWITSFYPKGKGFENWLKNTGDESEIIKKEAGDKGSLIHQAIAELLAGKTVQHDSIFVVEGREREITADEYESVLAFVVWFRRYNPKTLAYDFTVWNKKDQVAGTLDYICKIGDVIWVIDFKTSQSVYMNYELQLSGYGNSDYVLENYPNRKLAILQIGYRKNRDKFKFTEIEDRYELFLHTKAIWENEVKEKQPPQREFPLSVNLKGETDEERITADK